MYAANLVPWWPKSILIVIKKMCYLSSIIYKLPREKKSFYEINSQNFLIDPYEVVSKTSRHGVIECAECRAVTLIREINLISRNQLSLAKSTYKIKILWQMYILIALFSSKKVNGLMGGKLFQNNKF